MAEELRTQSKALGWLMTNGIGRNVQAQQASAGHDDHVPDLAELHGIENVQLEPAGHLPELVARGGLRGQDLRLRGSYPDDSIVVGVERREQLVVHVP